MIYGARSVVKMVFDYFTDSQIYQKYEYMALKDRG